MFERTPNAFSSQAAGGVARAKPAARPLGLGAQVNGWVDGVAPTVPSLGAPTYQAPANPAPDTMYASGGGAAVPIPATQGVAVGEPNPATPVTAAPLPVNDEGRHHAPFGSVTQEANNLGVNPIGHTDQRALYGALKADFPDMQGAMSQFASLDPAGRSAMMNQWLQSRPQFAQYKDLLMNAANDRLQRRAPPVDTATSINRINAGQDRLV